ncbi:MAG: HepT-like ribonuclease domain-containing protein [Bacteroidota bacterium]
MRDKLIHHYMGVDIEMIWNTVKQDIPFLDKELKEII